jgi:predicted nucleotidyltransferase
LFGSHATGTANEDSDIDLMIISSNFSGDIIEDSMKLMRLRRGIDNRIEPHPICSSDFNDENLFIQSIKSTMLKIA